MIEEHLGDEFCGESSATVCDEVADENGNIDKAAWDKALECFDHVDQTVLMSRHAPP